jgi:hypothetical protein
MVSHAWIKKWIKFLYGKDSETGKNSGYMSKGDPMPGPIDNKVLLDGQKCR